jgi:hypothetical protein
MSPGPHLMPLFTKSVEGVFSGVAKPRSFHTLYS